MSLPAKKHKKVNLTSSDLTQEKLRELRRVLPEAFSEDRIDWKKLRTVLGEHIDTSTEKFGFSWAGKNDAIKNVLTPSKATLKPNKKESIKFSTSENLFIEGDNLEVLKLLQKAYFERIKMIYIDPPYNRGNDLIYRDNFTAPLKSYLQQTGQIDSEGNKLQTNPETSGRYHSDWLSMTYPRLKLSCSLLKEEGVIFVSIDDHEMHHLRMVMDEIFGEENFIAVMVWEGALKNDSALVSISHDYIVCYARNLDKLKLHDGNWRTRKEGIDSIYKKVDELKEQYGSDYDKISESLKEWYSSIGKKHQAWFHRHYNKVDKKGVYFPSDISWPGGGGPTYEVLHPKTRKPVRVPARGWVYPSKQRMQEAISEERVDFGEDETKVPTLKRYLHETEGQVLPSVFYQDRRAAMQRLRSILGSDIFENPKDEAVIEKLIQVTTNENDIVLDFFAGSGSTAQAVLQLNQAGERNVKFILVQLPEPTDPQSNAHTAGYKTIADIAKARIRRVVKGYGKNPQPIDAGFKVFKLGESNYIENQFEFDPEKTGEENEELFQEYLKNARQDTLFDKIKDEDVIYENIIKEGLSLNAKITSDKIGNNNVYNVTDGEKEILISLDKELENKTVRRLSSPEYKNKIFICLDNALNDTLKANLALHVELKTI
ncbi:MAG: DNA methyltransferase [Thermodesulfobacteriota bacterium]